MEQTKMPEQFWDCNPTVLMFFHITQQTTSIYYYPVACLFVLPQPYWKIVNGLCAKEDKYNEDKDKIQVWNAQTSVANSFKQMNKVMEWWLKK